jgi:P-type E1-E2 ATPase
MLRDLHRAVIVQLENDLEFLGFIGIQDKIAPNVKETIEKIKNANIKVAMLTGIYILSFIYPS